GHQLERRADDDELTILRRLAVYREQTEPLEAFYRARDLLYEIDAEAPEGIVLERTMDALAPVT
ncbi:MAG: adenylate kinase, partial [Actinomycetota bacterium]